MDQPAIKPDDTNVVYRQWRFHETAEIEHKKQTLREEKRKFEEERRKFEREKREFSIHKKVENRRREQEHSLFEMKWKILEEEIKKLTAERQQVEKQRNFYRYVSEYEQRSASSEETETVKGDMFFVGVENEQSLKKRYKDLIKIYHPDNLGGDTKTIQEINWEYDRLKKQFE